MVSTVPHQVIISAPNTHMIYFALIAINNKINGLLLLKRKTKADKPACDVLGTAAKEIKQCRE